MSVEIKKKKKKLQFRENIYIYIIGQVHYRRKNRYFPTVGSPSILASGICGILLYRYQDCEFNVPKNYKTCI